MDQFKVEAALSSLANNAAAMSAAANDSENSMGPDDDGPKDGDRLDDMMSGDFSKSERGSQHHPVAEFLYQLTKMLSDDNREIIEWVDGRIKVHYPERLEGEVLHKYFRHSKFASFQRQLNYFGFRKIAGKGKMSPCSYVNESATSDIRSLLLIKRKTNGSAARKAMAQRALSLSGNVNPVLGSGMPGLTGAAAAMGGLSGVQGFSAMNQFQMQKQALGNFYGNDNAFSQLFAQSQQQRQSWNDLNQLGGLKPNMPSLEQLQAQLASLSNRQQNQGNGGATAALNAAAMNLSGSMNLAQFQNDNPATAALNAASCSMPATAAMNAAAGQSNNLFDSATNLKSLLGNDQMGNEGRSNGAQGLLNRLPSSSAMFPGSVSNASLGNLLASSNRLSSLLSLNSFLSREPSLADMAQFAALGVGQGASQEMANRFGHGNA